MLIVSFSYIYIRMRTDHVVMMCAIDLKIIKIHLKCSKLPILIKIYLFEVY